MTGSATCGDHGNEDPDVAELIRATLSDSMRGPAEEIIKKISRE
jgi:hypothetical protein